MDDVKSAQDSPSQDPRAIFHNRSRSLPLEVTNPRADCDKVVMKPFDPMDMKKIDKRSSPFARMIAALKDKANDKEEEKKEEKKKAKKRPNVSSIYRTRSENILKRIRDQCATGSDNSPEQRARNSVYARHARYSPGSEILDDGPVPPASWTKKIEEEVIRFADLCTDDSEDCKQSATMNDRISKMIQISLILFGASSIYVASSGIQEKIQQIVQSTLGGLTGLTTGIYGLFGFTKKSTIANDSAISLRRLARKLRLQVLLPDGQKVQDPLLLMLESEEARDRILKRL